MQSSVQKLIISTKPYLPIPLIGLSGYLLTLLHDSFYNSVGELLTYKGLLIICTLLILLSLYMLSLYYSVKHIKNSQATNKNDLDISDETIRLTRKTSLAPIEQKSIALPKKEPANPIDYEKFHTFNGLTYKFDVRDGTLYQGIYCPDDKVVMQSRYIFNNNYLWQCPICKKNHRLSDEESKLAHVNFSNILIAFTKGHLKKLPTESKKENS